MRREGSAHVLVAGNAAVLRYHLWERVVRSCHVVRADRPQV